MGLKNRLDNLKKYNPEALNIIENLLGAFESGEIIDNSEPKDMPIGVEFNTGKSLAGSLVYGIFIDFIIIPNGVTLLGVENVNRVVCSCTTVLQNPPNRIPIVFLENNEIGVENTRNEEQPMSIYLEYTKI